MEKQFGKGTILRLGSKAVVPVAVISTGSISLDNALGVGGLPRARVVEVFGPNLRADHARAAGDRRGRSGPEERLRLSTQNTRSIAICAEAGVDVEKSAGLAAGPWGAGLEITSALVATGAVDIVVVDSVAALVPKAELDGEMGDSHMGLHARLMSQALRKLTGVVSRCNCCLVFINQVREKIGVVFGTRRPPQAAGR